MLETIHLRTREVGLGHGWVFVWYLLPFCQGQFKLIPVGFPFGCIHFEFHRLSRLRLRQRGRSEADTSSNVTQGFEETSCCSN